MRLQELAEAGFYRDPNDDDADTVITKEIYIMH